MTLQSGPNLGVLIDGALGEAHYSELMRRWRALDALIQPWVISMSVAAQPATPANGDTYIVPAGATGAAWSGKTGQMARFSTTTGGWEFFVPKNGWMIYNRADGGNYLFTGSVWALQGSQKLNVPQDYISGLKMVWNSGTSISVTSGAAYVSSLGRLVLAGSTLTLSSLSLTASTWYHVYLYENAGAPAIECVTTAPAAPYNGNARVKTGDTSRRYVGSVRTDASGNIYNIKHVAPATIIYQVNTNAAPFLMLAAGNSTSTTSVNASSVVPVTAVALNATVLNAATNAAYVRISNSNGPDVASGYIVLASPNGVSTTSIPLDSAQTYTYAYDVTPTGTTYHRCFGYTYER